MPPKKKTATAEATISPLVPPLRTLLHTMRCVSQHEDALCTLLHNLEHAPQGSSDLHAELSALLEQLPAREYLDDLDAVHAALEATAGSNQAGGPKNAV